MFGFQAFFFSRKKNQLQEKSKHKPQKSIHPKL
jgi:hypothetical protein